MVVALFSENAWAQPSTRGGKKDGKAPAAETKKTEEKDNEKTAGATAGAASPDVERLTLPDSSEEALKTLKEWFDARDIESKLRKTVIILQRHGISINIRPLVYDQELDRLRFTSYYLVKKEFKKKPALQKAAARLNSSQNLLQVFVNPHHELTIGGNLSFYDEFSAAEFDAYIELYTGVIKRHILDNEVRKMLK